LCYTTVLGCLCPPKICVHPELMNVTLLENKYMPIIPAFGSQKQDCELDASLSTQ
jgi:hypothetical protein